MALNDETRARGDELRDGADDRDRARPHSPYTLIVRGSDGQPRSERFKDVAAYRARLARMTTADRSVSFEEIVRLLES